MKPACPKCGATTFRSSQAHGLWERLGAVLGVIPIRCRECHTRYTGRLWRPLDVIYARCPRCYRLDLSTWMQEHYHVSTWVRFKLFCGAHPWRCEGCRCNFASVRPRKIRFHYHRKVKRSPGETPAQNDGEFNQATQ